MIIFVEIEFFFFSIFFSWGDESLINDWGTPVGKNEAQLSHCQGVWKSHLLLRRVENISNITRKLSI